MTLRLVTTSADQTRACGERLGRAALAGDVILLSGPLGAGKTVLVQGLAAGLGATEQVASPTFVLVRHHLGRLPLVHADLYRLSRRDEVEALGLLELAAEGVLAVEWADRALWLAIPSAAELALDSGEGDKRDLSLTGGGAHLASAFRPEAA